MPRISSQTWTSLFFAALLMGSAQTNFAAGPVKANVGSTSQRHKQEAIRATPFDRLKPEMGKRLRTIINRTSVYRRMPVKPIHCDKDLYTFLVRHPNVIVGMWRVMDITNVSLQQLAPYRYRAADGSGTNCDVELVYGTPHLHVYLAKGYYQGTLFRRKLTGRCILVVRSSHNQRRGKPNQVDTTMDVFLQIDNVGLQLVARTFHPLVGKTADSNFMDSVDFLAQVSQVAEKNGRRMSNLAVRLKDIDVKTKRKLVELSVQAQRRSQLRLAKKK